jgi:ribonuclease J
MARLAAGMHQELSLEPGDTVIFSSRVIPGNDRAVLRVMNDVIRRGAQLHTYRTDPGVHTSGHASRPEQARMLELLAPRCFVPIHGTLQHMMRHAGLARELGIEQTLVVENGTSFVFDGERVRSDRSVPVSPVSIGFGGEAIDPEVLRQRSDLARYGLVLVTLVLDGRGRLVCPPQVVARGVSGCESGNGMRAAAVEVARAVERAGRRRAGNGGNGDLREDVRRAVRRQLERDAGCRPVIEVCITNADG